MRRTQGWQCAGLVACVSLSIMLGKPAQAAPAWLLPAGVRACPAQEPEATLELAEALVRALCSSPQARASWETLRAVEVDRAWLQGLRRPEVELSSSLGTVLERNRPPGEVTERQQGQEARLRLEAQWVLFDFGLRQAEQGSAEAALQAAQASHDLAIQQVMLSTVQAYLALAEAEGEWTLARSSESTVRELLAQALRPARPGQAKLDKIDELQARSSLAERLLELRRVQARVTRARGELAVLIGLAPTTQINLPRELRLEVGEDFEPALAALMAAAERQHPELLAARAQLRQAQSELDEARRSDRPSVRLSGDWQRGRTPDRSRRADAGASLQLVVPLFAGGDRARRVQRAQAGLAQARSSLQLAERERSLAVWNQYQTLREELAALRLGERWLAEAEALLAAERRAYQVGDSDMFDLLSANDSVLSARSSLLASRISLNLQRFLLASSLGRLPWPEASRPR